MKVMDMVKVETETDTIIFKGPVAFEMYDVFVRTLSDNYKTYCKKGKIFPIFWSRMYTINDLKEEIN